MAATQTPSPSSSDRFNLGFDEEEGQLLLSVVLDEVGCFSCRKKNPTNRCARCKFAKYCGVDCQKADWSRTAGNHREVCKVWRDNRGDGPEDEKRASIPVCLFSVDCLNQELLTDAMSTRTRLFLDEVRRCVGTGDISDPPIVSFQTSVIETMGKIRLVASARFFSNGRVGPVDVNHVLFHGLSVEDGAREKLYPPGDGSGDISEMVRNQVITTWIAFVEQLRERLVSVNSITYGRGLMWLSDDEDAKRAIETNNGEVNGVERRIMWIPSMDYAVNDIMGAAMGKCMEAMMGSTSGA